jgi:arsenate reductase (thioredoxin)
MDSIEEAGRIQLEGETKLRPARERKEIMEKKPKVLFLSTGNSTRSQIAEGFLDAMADDHFSTASAGIEAGGLDPVAAEVMKETGVDVGQHVEDLQQAIREHFAYVITVYDAAKEKSPVFPFTVNLMRWSLADPARVAVSEEEKREMFRHVRDQLRERVNDFVSQVHRKERERAELTGALR